MFGKSTVAWSVPLDMAQPGASALPRPRGRDAATHRHLTMALFPVFLGVVMAQRLLHLGPPRAAARQPILREAWSSASTASTFAFLG